MTDTLLASIAHRILLAANQADMGVKIRVQSREDMITPALRAKQVLYRFKKDDPDFKNLQIRLDPDEPNTRLWIIRGHLIADVPDDNPPSDPVPRKSGTPFDIDL